MTATQSPRDEAPTLIMHENESMTTEEEQLLGERGTTVRRAGWFSMCMAGIVAVLAVAGLMLLFVASTRKDAGGHLLDSLSLSRVDSEDIIEEDGLPTRANNGCVDGFQFDHKGWWLNGMYTPAGDVSINACAEKCRENGACKGFSYGRRQCFTYNDLVRPVESAGGATTAMVKCSNDLAIGLGVGLPVAAGFGFGFGFGFGLRRRRSTPAPPPTPPVPPPSPFIFVKTTSKAPKPRPPRKRPNISTNTETTTGTMTMMSVTATATTTTTAGTRKPRPPLKRPKIRTKTETTTGTMTMTSVTATATTTTTTGTMTMTSLTATTTSTSTTAGCCTIWGDPHILGFACHAPPGAATPNPAGGCPSTYIYPGVYTLVQTVVPTSYLVSMTADSTPYAQPASMTQIKFTSPASPLLEVKIYGVGGPYGCDATLGGVNVVPNEGDTYAAQGVKLYYTNTKWPIDGSLSWYSTISLFGQLTGGLRLRVDCYPDHLDAEIYLPQEPGMSGLCGDYVTLSPGDIPQSVIDDFVNNCPDKKHFAQQCENDLSKVNGIVYTNETVLACTYDKCKAKEHLQANYTNYQAQLEQGAPPKDQIVTVWPAHAWNVLQKLNASKKR